MTSLMGVLDERDSFAIEQQRVQKDDLHLAGFSYSLLQIKLTNYPCQPQQGTNYTSVYKLLRLKVFEEHSLGKKS